MLTSLLELLEVLICSIVQSKWLHNNIQVGYYLYSFSVVLNTL